MNALTLFDSNVWENNLWKTLDTLTTNIKPLLPYNWVKEDNKLTLEIAVAGYSKDDLDIEVKDGSITITGKAIDDKEVNFLHKGISSKGFKYAFPYVPTYEFKEATMKDGMLRVIFEKEDVTSYKVEIKSVA